MENGLNRSESNMGCSFRGNEENGRNEDVLLVHDDKGTLEGLRLQLYFNRISWDHFDPKEFYKPGDRKYMIPVNQERTVFISWIQWKDDNPYSCHHEKLILCKEFFLPSEPIVSAIARGFHLAINSMYVKNFPTLKDVSVDSLSKQVSAFFGDIYDLILSFDFNATEVRIFKYATVIKWTKSMDLMNPDSIDYATMEIIENMDDYYNALVKMNGTYSSLNGFFCRSSFLEYRENVGNGKKRIALQFMSIRELEHSNLLNGTVDNFIDSKLDVLAVLFNLYIHHNLDILCLGNDHPVFTRIEDRAYKIRNSCHAKFLPISKNRQVDMKSLASDLLVADLDLIPIS